MEQEIKQNFYVVVEKENCIMVTWGGEACECCKE